MIYVHFDRLDEPVAMVWSKSSFDILLFDGKLHIPTQQVRTPKHVELVKIKPYNYAL
jgi:hypothetical protein